MIRFFCYVLYCIPLAEIKNFNTLIDNKPILNQPVKKNKKHKKNLSKYQETIQLNYTYKIKCCIRLHNRKLIRLFLASKIL